MQIAFQKTQQGNRSMPAYEALYMASKNLKKQQQQQQVQVVEPTEEKKQVSKEEHEALFHRLASTNINKEREIDAVRQVMEQQYTYRPDINKKSKELVCWHNYYDLL